MAFGKISFFSTTFKQGIGLKIKPDKKPNLLYGRYVK